MNAHEPTLDDLLEQQRADEAARRRDEGRDRGLHAAHPYWRLHAEDALERLARRGVPFTADDLHAEAGDQLGNASNSAIGGLFSRAARRGLIRHVGYTTSTRPAAHGRVLRQWCGTGGGGQRAA